MLRVLLSLYFAICCLAADPHPNFTGTWQLLPTASDFGQAAPPKSMTSRIRHLDPALIVNSTVVDTRGEQQSEYRWWTDGYPCANTVRGLTFATKVVWEGAILVASSTSSGAQGEIDMTDRWSLSKDGKTLKVARVLKTGGKWVEQSYVYERNDGSKVKSK